MGRIPACRPLDYAEVTEYLRQPDRDLAAFPFKAPRDGRREASNERRQAKGTRKNYGPGKTKYASNALPRSIKLLLKNSAPLQDSSPDRKWRRRFLAAISNSLASATWQKYESAVNAYKRFCAAEGASFDLPAAPEKLNKFILWGASDGRLAVATLRAYLAALNTVSGILGKEPLKNKTQHYLLEGLENAARQLNRKPEVRPAVTYQVLKKLIERVNNKRWKTYSRLLVSVYCRAAYFGSFRAGELLSKQERTFDPLSDLLWEDVSFRYCAENHIKSAIIHVKIPKTKIDGGEYIELFGFADENFCPVAGLEKLKTAQKARGIWAGNLPVFRFTQSRNLTVKRATKIIQKISKEKPRMKGKFSAGSFRSGIPSDMEGRPDIFKDTSIQCWGRWRSDAYRRYMKGGHERRRVIAKKIEELLLGQLI